MERRTSRAIHALGALGLGLGMMLSPSAAEAQLFGGGPATPPSGGAAMAGAAQPSAGSAGAMAVYGNPYANPYMNPFINPYMTQSSMATGNPALYFMAAQQMNGGIGSGRLGGPPPAGLTAKGKASASAEADASRPTGANTPGATASRYFSRNTPANTGAARYYGRQNRHFPNNGR